MLDHLGFRFFLLRIANKIKAPINVIVVCMFIEKCLSKIDVIIGEIINPIKEYARSFKEKFKFLNLLSINPYDGINKIYNKPPSPIINSNEPIENSSEIGTSIL